MSTPQYLIYESAVSGPITNIQNNGSIVHFTTRLQEADVKNRNGRIYPKIAIENGLNSPIIKEMLARHTLFGEVGHPVSTDLARQTNVDQTNAAFRINEFYWEGNSLYGKCETLDTEKGRDMAGLIRQGCQLAFSMRGQGAVTKDPYRDAMVVSENLVIITFDWVWLPSHQNAYITEINEATEATMLNYNVYSDKQVALTESMNLYENGLLVDLNNDKKEKEVIDYRMMNSTGYMALSEMYHYNPNDKIKEFKDSYVILENDNNILYVGKEDYLLKSTRNNMLEMSVAPTDNTLAITDDRLGKDIPGVVYKNPLEKEVKEKVGDKAQDVSADALKEESSVDEPEGTKIPEGTEAKKDSDESNPKVETKEVTDTKHTDKDVKGIEELKEEFYKYYNIIAEETGLTKKEEIINRAIDYTDFMSEECALLFKSLVKDGE